MKYFFVFIGVITVLFINGDMFEKEYEPKEPLTVIALSELVEAAINIQWIGNYSINYNENVSKEMWEGVLRDINKQYFEGINNISLYYGEIDGGYLSESREIKVECIKKEYCEAIIYHEIGHHVHLSLLNDIIREKICIIYNNTEPLTERANQIIGEYFAELFRLYYNKSELPTGDIHKQKRDLTKEENEIMDYIVNNLDSINPQPNKEDYYSCDNLEIQTITITIS